ncbi:MAG TPA: zincin-like metallopeptidase domain-containing protein [Pseudolabrys sp.]|nr:zincin-like metallopeptidase domain-containing protein [Pseudolabrys sp.]
MRTDIYQKITDQIVSELEKGVRPWLKPWNAEHAAGRITRPLRGNGIPYKGINVLMLWSAAMEKGYAAPTWMTFKQASELNACVRKGEHGSLVVYADKIIRTETDTKTGEDSERAIPFLKGYTAFNVEQIDGLPEHYYAKPAPRVNTVTRIERAETFFAATGATVRHGGAMAYYNVSQDFVQLPPFESFRDAESYYATRAHENIHWTRHPSRLNRDFGRKRYGDEGYAMEELVAELGSAFLSSDLDLTPELREDHACYLASWIKVLKDDKRAIFTAASHAQRAADYLHGLNIGECAIRCVDQQGSCNDRSRESATAQAVASREPNELQGQVPEKDKRYLESFDCRAAPK